MNSTRGSSFPSENCPCGVYADLSDIVFMVRMLSSEVSVDRSPGEKMPRYAHELLAIEEEVRGELRWLPELSGTHDLPAQSGLWMSNGLHRIGQQLCDCRGHGDNDRPAAGLPHLPNLYWIATGNIRYVSAWIRYIFPLKYTEAFTP